MIAAAVTAILCYPLCMLETFGPSLYVADGPVVSFFGFPYTTRMAVAQLSDGGCGYGRQLL